VPALFSVDSGRAGRAAALAPFRFDTIYGHYFDRVIRHDGEAVLQKSVARYLKAIGANRG